MNPLPGTPAYAPGHNDPVAIERRWQWPFPYAECRTSRGVLISVPISRLEIAGEW